MLGVFKHMDIMSEYLHFAPSKTLVRKPVSAHAQGRHLHPEVRLRAAAVEGVLIFLILDIFCIDCRIFNR